MKMKRDQISWPKVIIAAAMLAAGGTAMAGPMTLGGMGIVGQWTDYDNQSGEMPINPWGNSDSTTDRVGIFVEYANGLTGSATYSGLAGKWGGCCNIGGGLGITPDTETGFFVGTGSYAGLHGIDNNGFVLPMAFSDLRNAFTSNFDLSYENSNDSTWRANVSGWQSATISLYSSAAPANDVPEPGSLALAGLGLAGLAAARRRRG